MKKIFTLLFCMLSIICFAQKNTFITEDYISKEGKHVLTSKKESFLMDNRTRYSFRLQAIADENSTEWFILLTSKENLPHDNSLLLKFEDDDIEELPLTYMQADTTVVYKSSTYMYDFWGGFAVGTTSGYNAIDKINYMAVHKISEEQLDKIAIKKITKIRVGDALGYANKEWKKRNPLGVYLSKCRNLMTKSITDIREKEKTVYDGF